MPQTLKDLLGYLFIAFGYFLIDLDRNDYWVICRRANKEQHISKMISIGRGTRTSSFLD